MTCQGTCFDCKGPDHKLKCCRARQHDGEDSRVTSSDENWVQEFLLVVMNGENILEYGLMGKDAPITFASNAKILNDPNVFIGDTGTTSDTTSSKYGFVNIREATSNASIADASRNGIAGSVVGDLKGTICNNL